MVRGWLVRLVAVAGVVAVAGCTAFAAGGGGSSAGGAGGAAASGVSVSNGGGGTAAGRPVPRVAAPPLRVEEVAGGLENPWDLAFLPDGRLLVTERPGRLVLLSGPMPGAEARPVDADFGDLLAKGEGGLMGLALLPDFAGSRRFVTCQTHTEGGQPRDVRVVVWELSPDFASARRVRDPLVGGLPLNPSGRHSGCRPALAPDGTLLIGTGDTARGAFSQDRTNLGGKVLRVDPATGAPAAGNPFAGSANPNERLIWTYGHRNVQGVAIRPGTDQVFVAEQGPDYDDEVNLLAGGRNYGWDPSRGGTVGGYQETVPMTDLTRFPDAVPARWSSGETTEATAGAAFLSGGRWGTLEGALAVPALKGSKLLLMTLAPDGTAAELRVPAELDDKYGRLRSARLSPSGDLYLTTDNGSSDVVLRVSAG
ncbi:PQQ-dependent sugar dehydrogenase [Pseudonocardia acaciae]|uniref:PQQ-dependent sugar dehydrogenase n=1 Tax=Pseudonocardia acaciae TaxID=551276 RepID=UPI0009FD4840|nr:PQQ-dependent sugar dehydrogenase [Pseudonocardia acaciae]